MIPKETPNQTDKDSLRPPMLVRIDQEGNEVLKICMISEENRTKLITIHHVPPRQRGGT